MVLRTTPQAVPFYPVPFFLPHFIIRIKLTAHSSLRAPLKATLFPLLALDSKYLPGTFLKVPSYLVPS